jgi:hypothetical protein
MNKNNTRGSYHDHLHPYAKHVKEQVTLCLGVDVVDYFKKLADETGIPYQNLINLYLQDCAKSPKKTEIQVGISIQMRNQSVHQVKINIHFLTI